MTDARADTDKEGATSSARLFSALVEVGRDGWATVWVGELLGLFVNESSEDEALRQLPGAIVACLQWLRQHGEDTEALDAVTVAVTERQTPELDLAYGEYAALFARDRVPVSDDDLVQAMRWMRYMRDDTLDLVARLPAGAMEWRRTPDHKYSIADYLEHIARAERWYLTRLWPEVPPHVPGPRRVTLPGTGVPAPSVIFTRTRPIPGRTRSCVRVSSARTSMGMPSEGVPSAARAKRR